MAQGAILKETQDFDTPDTKYCDKKFISYNASSVVAETEKEEYEKFLNLTSLSIKMFASSFYKETICLDTNDVDQIKAALNNYVSKNDAIKKVKEELLGDLTIFQKQIRDTHVQRISTLMKDKKQFEKELATTEYEKNKIIMERLSKIVWPYDNKTKELDVKIEKLQLQIKKCQSKVDELQKIRPIANEKDIIIYQMHLKEQYGIKTV